MSIQVRQASPVDYPVIGALLHEAFGDEPVTPLVTALRRCSGYVPEFELVAEDDGEVVGHVMLTWNHLLLDSGGRRPILVIAPLAVRPDRWRRGIGRTLIEGAVRRAEAAGEPFAVLEGDPAYYGRLGFVAAGTHGVRPPSPTVPEVACQLYPLAGPDPAVAGRVMYDEAFWANGGSGLPEDTDPDTDPDGGYPLPYLFYFAQLNGWIEAVTYGADLDVPVAACPGWTLRDLLAHLEWAYRAASCWDRTGEAPAPDPVSTTDGPVTPDPLPGFSDAWRETYTTLVSRPPATPSRGWTSVDRTVGAWRRRMVHEVAVHAADVLDSLPSPRFPWRIDDALALDGIDHTLGVFAARLPGGTPAGGASAGDAPDIDASRGRMVRLTSGNRSWTVVLDGTGIAVLDASDVVPDAGIEAEPADLYLWLWGRTPAVAVRVDGDQWTAERFLEATRYARS